MGPLVVCLPFVDPSDERKHVRSTLLRKTGRIAVGALLLAYLAIPPAHATPGLYGSQDATYDGVYRHSLVILGLTAHGQRIPTAATRWLAQQQCADGGFEPYRADTMKPCTPPDPTNYVGEETNATSAGAMALAAVGQKARATRALNYLRTAQNADGGFAYYVGGASDVNSTAMAILAFRANGVAPASVQKDGKNAFAYLSANMLGCNSTTPGAFTFWGEASDKASVQALVALRPSLPWKGAVAMNDFWPACPTPTKTSSLWSASAFHITKQLSSNAFQIPIPAAWGGGSDTSDTAWAALGLVGSGRDIATSTVEALRGASASYVVDKQGNALAGRVALLLLVTAASGDSPRSFGGVDLLKLATGALGR